MNDLAFILGGATGGAFGIWLCCYVLTREAIQDAAQAKVERSLDRRGSGRER